jgi:hypothetical protein
MKFKELSWDCKVDSVVKTEADKDGESKISYKLVLSDLSGNNKVVISSDEPFSGVNSSSGVLQVVVCNSQKSIKDFELPKKEEKESEEDEA